MSELVTQSVSNPSASQGDTKERPPVIESAIKVLLERCRKHRRRTRDLLDADSGSESEPDSATDWVFLVLTLQCIPENMPRRPRLIPLPNPLYRSTEPGDAVSASLSVCVVCPDPVRPYRRFLVESPPAQWRERIRSLRVTEVLSVRQLRRDYLQFEQRRRLAAKHDLFLADTRVWPLLPDLLGKEFFRRKKYPLPVNFSGLDQCTSVVAERVIRACERVRDSTVWYPGLAAGTCCAIRVGRLSMSPEALKANVEQVLHQLPTFIPGGIRRGVLSIYLKTRARVPIPLYVADRKTQVLAASAPVRSNFTMWSPERRRRRSRQTKQKLVRVPDTRPTPLAQKRQRQ